MIYYNKVVINVVVSCSGKEDEFKMVKCPACEMEYSDSLTSCPYCGTNSPSLSRVLVITREKRFVGSAVSPNIYLNGMDLGKLYSGGRITTNVTVGSNRISVVSYDMSMRKKKVNDYNFIVKKSSVSQGLISMMIDFKPFALTLTEFYVKSVTGL